MGQGHVTEPEGPFKGQYAVGLQYPTGVQGGSPGVRVLFWRNHSGSSVEGTMTGGMGAVVIVQVRETEQELWDGEAGDGQERRCGTLLFPPWLVDSSHGPGGLSA